MRAVDLRYPIGSFKGPLRISTSDRVQYLEDIDALPAQINEAVDGLNDQKLDTPYRPKGWSIRQVVHHLADSHANSYIRFKWALTEDQPIIKAYDEKDWANRNDSLTAPIDISLTMLEGIHQRWAWVLRNMKDEEWSKFFIHPETKRQMPLDFSLALYAWHGKHHLAHITSTKERQGW